MSKLKKRITELQEKRERKEKKRFGSVQNQFEKKNRKNVSKKRGNFYFGDSLAKQKCK